MYPGLDVTEEDAPADRRLLEGLADWCDRYTPLVAIDGQDGLFLDITGCAHLFGGEKALLDDLARRFFHQGFDVRTGLASTPGAAWAAARYCAGTIVAAGEEERLMCPLPLAALRLDAGVRSGLESVGLRSVGAVLSTPRAPLARRFGHALLLRIDQALGAVEEAISPRRPVPPLSAERQLAEPIGLVDDIVQVVRQLATSLAEDLDRRGEGARLLDLLLFRVDGWVGRLSAGASRPLRDPPRIEALFRERLAAIGERIDAGFGFDLIRLCATSVANRDPEQGAFGGTSLDRGEDLSLFADRMRARLGDAAVLACHPVASHRPERAVALRPFDEAATASSEAPDASARPVERPIRLFAPPEPVEVVAAIPDGPPAHFRWRRTLYQVARAEGPERIAPEWWRGDDPADTRDYFRVEDAAGRRYWIGRHGLYGTAAQPRWFLHGLFA